MSHFAKVENEIVTQVIVAEQDFIDIIEGDWIQTSYNTRGGVHYGTDGQPDNGTQLRYNYAGIGYTYNSNADAFYAPQPFASWALNTTTYLWEPPVPYPTDNKVYTWDEVNKLWVESND